MTSSKFLAIIFNLATFNPSAINENFDCHHFAVAYFFIDSVRNDCKYNGFPCQSYDSFTKGECHQCSQQGCNKIGYWAFKDKDIGSLYSYTQPPNRNSSFCKNSFRINLISNNLKEMVKTRGTISVTLFIGRLLK